VLYLTKAVNDLTALLKDRSAPPAAAPAE